MFLNELLAKSVGDLFDLAQDMKMELSAKSQKADMVVALLKNMAKQGEKNNAEGLLEIVQDGYGFLRVDQNVHPGPADIYVSPSQIRKLNLRTGDTVRGFIRPPKDSERYFAMVQAEAINGEEPVRYKRRRSFDDLTPEFPNQRLRLERGDGTTADLTGRAIDLVAPIGKGQRALLVAPPKAGKTIVLQNIAESITKNNPDCKLIVLLIDERPEEVTEMRRCVKGEVVASTFDESASRHVQVADMVIAKAKRLVEQKQDVVILLDSITRLARAYNTVTPSSGKVLTGGVEANALQRPKRFFGAARNVCEGGSLTIVATALVETGSKMDDVIYEEFKGTGNMEVHLARHIAQRGIYPAIVINESSTRRDDMLCTQDELKRVRVLRKYLMSMEDHAATEFLIERLKSTKTNDAFFEAMRSG